MNPKRDKHVYDIWVKITLALSAAMLFATGMNIGYLTRIPRGGDPDTDYFIDVYKYMYYGEEVVKQSELTHVSIYNLSEDYEPNPQSRGIIYLNAIMYLIVPSWYCVPLFFGLIYYSLFYLLYRIHHFNTTLLLFPFYALYLHIFTPSKEAFFFISFFILIIGFLKKSLWPLGGLGFILMAVARPEGAAIFVFTLIAWKCMQNRIGRYVFMAGSLVIYVLVRNDLFDYCLLDQSRRSYSDSDLFFCQVGPLHVCFNSKTTFELIVLQRLATVILLPVKWVWNITQVGSNGGWLVSDLYHRLAVIIHLILAFIVLNANKASAYNKRQVREMMLCFAAVYIVIYGSLVYYQLSREFIVASCIALVAMTVTSENCNRSLAGHK